LEMRVVLVEPEHDGNVGLIARSMKNFGFSDLWLVNPKAKLGPEARALASHAQDLLAKARVVPSLEDVVKDCDYTIATTAVIGGSPSNICRKPLTLKEFAQRVVKMKTRAAILFGRESSGLTNMEIAGCDLVVTIPTNSDYGTLNIATAVSVTLYELQEARRKAAGHFETADKEARQRLLKLFEELSEEVCLPKHRIPLVTKALSNVLSRSLITNREASLMMGPIRRAIDRIRLNGKTKRKQAT